MPNGMYATAMDKGRSTCRCNILSGNHRFFLKTIQLFFIITIIFFNVQKSAGVLYYIRDTLCQRINMRLEKSSDLSENTLTAAAQLMLSQAMECFVDKAHDGKPLVLPQTHLLITKYKKQKHQSIRIKPL